MNTQTILAKSDDIAMRLIQLQAELQDLQTETKGPDPKACLEFTEAIKSIGEALDHLRMAQDAINQGVIS